MRFNMSPLDQMEDIDSMDKKGWWRQAIMGVYIFRNLMAMGKITSADMYTAGMLATLELGNKYPNAEPR